ncbi:hypothetical protein R8Z50_15110 [Longispora sp. K20-0274]|uniref:hypothetical protein n=1 Tax=Longispora sp. K20-0274 TaxID=3088255 RepID=UPI00399AE159
MTPRTLLSRFRREGPAGTPTPVTVRDQKDGAAVRDQRGGAAVRGRDGATGHGPADRAVPDRADQDVPDRAAPPDRDLPGRPAPAEPAVEVRGRTGVTSVLALVVGLTALYAALTGVLARPALLVGLLGLVLAVTAVVRPTRRRVTGNGLAVLGALLSVAALAIGIAVATGSLPGLDGGTDQVVRVRDWFAGWWPWMGA